MRALADVSKDTHGPFKLKSFTEPAYAQDHRMYLPSGDGTLLLCPLAHRHSTIRLADAGHIENLILHVQGLSSRTCVRENTVLLFAREKIDSATI